MANLKFTRYRDNRGNDRFDPIDKDEIGGLSQQHLDKVKAAGHTVEIVNDRKAASIFDSGNEGDTALMEAMDSIYTAMIRGKGTDDFAPVDRTGGSFEDMLMRDVNDRLSTWRRNDDALMAAGVNKGEFMKGKGQKAIRSLKRLDTGRLKGNEDGSIPAPYVRNIPGHQLRVHIKEQADKELVPFMDNGQPVVSDFGMLSGLGEDTASERVALTAAKLMDEGSVKMNRQRGMKRDRYGQEYEDDMTHYADLKRGDEKIEAMMAQRGGELDNTMAIPVYTNLTAPSGTQMEKALNDLKRAGYSTEGGVEKLIEQGVYDDNGAYRWGKLGRSDINNVQGDREAVYDSLLVTGFPSQLVRDARTFKPGFKGRPAINPHPDAQAFASDNLAVAPETLHMVDLPGLRAALERGEVVPKATIQTPNDGKSGFGHARNKVQEIIPQNNQYITDLTMTHPYTQQLLRELPLL